MVSKRPHHRSLCLPISPRQLLVLIPMISSPIWKGAMWALGTGTQSQSLITETNSVAKVTLVESGNGPALVGSRVISSSSSSLIPEVLEKHEGFEPMKLYPGYTGMFHSNLSLCMALMYNQPTSSMGNTTSSLVVLGPPILGLQDVKLCTCISFPSQTFADC